MSRVCLQLCPGANDNYCVMPSVSAIKVAPQTDIACFIFRLQVALCLNALCSGNGG